MSKIVFDFISGKRRREGGSSSSSPNMLVHQPIAGQQQVRCTCGADDDLEDGLGLSPSPPLSPAHHVSDHTGSGTGHAPVLQAERRLNHRLLENVSEKPNPNMQSKSDTFVPLLTQESTNNNSNVPLESQYSPEVQLKYKDTNAQTTSTSQAANDNGNVGKKITSTTSSSREPKTPFVAGFQTLGRNYNMPDYLIQWQADQFSRSERRHRQELARQGRLDEAVNDCPVYLNKETGKVPPMPVVRSKSAQVKAAEVGQQELGHVVQKEKYSSQKVSSNKAKATKTEKVTFRILLPND